MKSNNVFKFAPFGRRTSLTLGRLTQRSAKEDNALRNHVAADR